MLAASAPTGPLRRSQLVGPGSDALWVGAGYQDNQDLDDFRSAHWEMMEGGNLVPQMGIPNMDGCM